VTGSDETIDIAMKSLRDFGFINYYGMQRFGTTRVTTHDIGRFVATIQYNIRLLKLDRMQADNTGSGYA